MQQSTTIMVQTIKVCFQSVRIGPQVLIQIMHEMSLLDFFLYPVSIITRKKRKSGGGHDKAKNIKAVSFQFGISLCMFGMYKQNENTFD